MHSFLDSLVPSVEKIEDAPEAFKTTLHGLMTWLRASSMDRNVHAFCDAVTARIPELVGANVANTAAAPREKDDESEGNPDRESTDDSASDGDHPVADDVEDGGGVPRVDAPDRPAQDAAPPRSAARRQRPSAQETVTNGPAAGSPESAQPPTTGLDPNTAPPASGFAGFSQHVDGIDAAATPPDPHGS